MTKEEMVDLSTDEILEYINELEHQLELYKSAYNSANEVNHIQGDTLDKVKEIVEYVLVPYTRTSDKYQTIFELATAIEEVIVK